MAISPYLRELRAVVGHRLLVVPGVTTLIWDDEGRLLLVRSVHTGQWQTLGGAVEPDESPAQAAVREPAEEVGVTVALDRLRAAIGGPAYRFSYPNGDEVAYVGSVYDAHVIAGTPRPDGDGDEVTESRWFTAAELNQITIEPLSRALLADVGVLPDGEA